ncbi:MAG: DUF2813 domain-containing protein [Bacteroidetes bacterium]|nr:MAG: DUF2813 domain-containing protein [Bacteroidota bacterium]
MYITQVEIQHIRSIQSLNIKFPEDRLSGWHVIIGDNGAGKSSLVRAIAMALVGPYEIKALRINPRDFLRQGSTEGHCVIWVQQHQDYDRPSGKGKSQSKWDFPAGIGFRTAKGKIGTQVEVEAIKPDKNHKVILDPERYHWGSGKGWFSASFGPFRRFTGGNREWEKVFYSNPRLAAHLSAFGEDVALTEALEWLQQLHYRSLENRQEETHILQNMRTFINTGELLPHRTRLEEVSSEGVFFVDGNESRVPVTEMSDGYRSVLSMTFELIRQMVDVYGAEEVFKEINEGNPIIDLPGVVLIDEVDAHLHPTWQVRIGKWFTRYFPQIQFIVTTHSPLICRAAEKGSVWRLAAPGSGLPSEQVKGTELKRLIYGNVLDAYSTEVFGENVTRSEEAHELLDELAHLNKKSIKGTISKEEQKRLQDLRTIFPTEPVKE